MYGRVVQCQQTHSPETREVMKVTSGSCGRRWVGSYLPMQVSLLLMMSNFVRSQLNPVCMKSLPIAYLQRQGRNHDGIDVTQPMLLQRHRTYLTPGSKRRLFLD